MPAPPRRLLPPGPINYLGWLTYRHALRLWWNPIRFVTNLTRRYGDILTFRLFTHRAFVINSPAGVHQVLVEHADAFCKQRRQMRILGRVFQRGLLVTEGSLWKQQRQIVQRAFNRTNMSRYIDTCADETCRRMQDWTENRQLDFTGEVAAILVATMGRIFFGNSFAGQQHILLDTVREVSRSLIREIELILPASRQLPTAANRRRRQATQQLASMVDDLISERRQSSDSRSEDFITLLLHETATLSPSGRPDLDQVRDEVTTLLVAANHTITAAAEWMFKAIVENKTVCRSIQDELDSVLQGELITWDDQDRLPYTQAVVRETLRLYPPAWSLFVREAVRDVEIQGFRIQAGEWVFIYPILLHRDPRSFPDPATFDPTRFLNEHHDSPIKGAYIPFGAGPHICIGANLSHAVLTTLLATVLQRYTPVDAGNSTSRGQIIRDVAMRPAGGVPVRLMRRVSVSQQPSQIDSLA